MIWCMTSDSLKDRNRDGRKPYMHCTASAMYLDPTKDILRYHETFERHYKTRKWYYCCAHYTDIMYLYDDFEIHYYKTIICMIAIT